MPPLSAVSRSLRVVSAFLLVVTAIAISSACRAQTATSTVLAITSAGAPVSTVSAGTVVTLTATVTAGSTPVTPGLVKFCDASAKYCEDIHIIGTAQLTSSGTAVIKFRPGVGSRSYKAVFVGTKKYAPSSSDSSPLTVTVATSTSTVNPTSTAFSATGGLRTYDVTATVTGTGLFTPAPSGSVSFVDASNGNTVLAQASLGSGAPTLGLLNLADPAIGHAPCAIAEGDFNEDGIPDLAIISYWSETVTVWLGNGDGTFRSAGSYATGEHPSAIAVADFNSDGNPDLAITNYGSGSEYQSLTILLGKGDGTFTPAATISAVAEGPEWIVAGDFNGVGIPDLAVVGEDAITITVLLGKGDGTFSDAPAISFPDNANPYIVAGDFNGDGNLDLATFTLKPSSDVVVLAGKGDGTFSTRITTSVSFNTSDFGTYMATADLNGDGVPDLVVSVESKPTVLIGAGNGTFTIGSSLDANQIGTTSALTIGDFNGDGFPDLAAYNQNEMYFFLGVGDGTFTNGPTFDGNSIVSSQDFRFGGLVSADINGDGLADVVGTGGANSTGAGQLVPLISIPASISTASASITVGTGNHLVKASYPGDTNYGSSVSSTTTLAGPGVTTLGLAVSSGPHVYGQSLVLTATLSPYSASGYSTNGEPISFYNNGTLIGSGTLSSGVATLSLSSLSAGSYSFSANYGGDGKFLTSTSSTVPVTISQATPTITWATPAAITYGTALSATQLDASSSVPGTFAYTPAAGTVLKVGSQTLKVTFTPTDTVDYTTNNASATLTVNQATPAISWATPAVITYGTALSATQLDASSPVAGTFSYAPPAGAILAAGSHMLNVTFTPTDTVDYTTNTANVQLTVNQAKPAITWAIPAAITYGTALSATQLDASSTVAGTFVYTPAAGTVLSAGSQKLSVTITPTDTTDYTTNTQTVQLTVNKAPLSITVNSATRSFGAANPTFTGTVSGLLNGDTVTVTYSTAATPTSPVGTYPITASISGAAAGNYALTVTPGTLTVTVVPPTLTSPKPGSTLTGSSETFTWNPGGGSREFLLRVGTTKGGIDIYNGAWTTGNSAAMTGIPTYGVTLYARLYYMAGTTYYYIDYSFTESGTPVKAVLSSPTPGSTLTGSSATFTWTTGGGVTRYEFRLGTAGPGSTDVYNKADASTAALTTGVISVPAYGVTIYARLYSYINGAWQYNDYTYMESGSPVKAILTSPTPGSTLTGSSATFTWTAGGGVTRYEFRLGTTGPGSANVYNSADASTTALTTGVISNIPTTGATLYARIYSLINGVWQYNDYTFTEQ